MSYKGWEKTIPLGILKMGDLTHLHISAVQDSSISDVCDCTVFRSLLEMIRAQQLKVPLVCCATLSTWQPLTKLYCLKCTNPRVTFGKYWTFSWKKSVFRWVIISHCQSQGVIGQAWRTYMIDSFTQLWKIAQNLLFPSLANASKPLEMIWGPLDPATPSLRTSPSSLSLLW